MGKLDDGKFFQTNIGILMKLTCEDAVIQEVNGPVKKHT